MRSGFLNLLVKRCLFITDYSLFEGLRNSASVKPKAIPVTILIFNLHWNSYFQMFDHDA